MSLNCSIEVKTIDSTTVTIKYLVGGWLTLMFCSCGIMTNIFTVVILMHPRMRNSSTHVYLMVLSACNIFLLAGIAFNYSIKSIASYPELLAYLQRPNPKNRMALLGNAYEQFYAHVAPFTTPLLSMLLLCSTYFTVLLSGDRYFLICWPLIAEKIRTRKMALRLVSLVFILVNIYILPHWFEYSTATRNVTSVQSMTNSSLNENETSSRIASPVKLVELAYTRLGSSALYLSIYRFYLNVPITFVIPFTLLTLCNGSMIHQLLLIKRKKKRLGHRMKADIRITTMLIVIVLTFMLCRSINLFVNLFVQISPCLNQNSLQRFNTFANLLIAFNGFINFFLFAVFGQRFREMVLYIFLRHGQHPFLAGLDGISGHRSGACGPMSATDMPNRKSRRASANDSDLWAAMTRRRSSATMAVLYSATETRLRSVSHSSVGSSHLNIPTYTNGDRQHVSNSSICITESPFPNSSYQQLSSNYNDIQPNITNVVPVQEDNRHKNQTPSCMKKRAEDLTPGTMHRVKFV
ncbi:unnamed protein product [Rotaria magnacalcarata]|uniref:G-protein coupled receptors family 1 profile domain-containing protein n=7 Tax=Rotaria magnacalcarata TaxID=392030 RepID=A0A815GMI7_9BILA|nr:unnamed protein product [Rotaria magnacalcarata]CAF2058786.1 unnamed protein product [Rotaria magnacalcarata]CAF3875984.1 unnamed protein product [Rotaria magnacalcarata]CAF3888385.1 unnamed protein product [Rotaria magnacalcarata]